MGHTSAILGPYENVLMPDGNRACGFYCARCGLGSRKLHFCHRSVCGGVFPDATIVVDCPPTATTVLAIFGASGSVTLNPGLYCFNTGLQSVWLLQTVDPTDARTQGMLVEPNSTVAFSVERLQTLNWAFRPKIETAPTLKTMQEKYFGTDVIDRNWQLIKCAPELRRVLKQLVTVASGISPHHIPALEQCRQLNEVLHLAMNLLQSVEVAHETAKTPQGASAEET